MSATYDPGRDTLLMRRYSSGVAIAVTTAFLVHALASGAHKSFAKRLSVAIVFGNWLHAVDDFAGIYWQSKTLCTIYGAVRSWSLLVCATWSVVLAANIHHLLRHNRAIRVPEPWLHAVCWLLPAVLALLPLVDSLSYGEAQLWCWITSRTKLTTVLQFVAFYIPLWTMLGIICTLFARTMATVYEVNRAVMGRVHGGQTPKTPQELMLYSVRKLIPFPAIFVVTWIPGTLHRVYGLFSHNTPDTMRSVHAVSLAVQGVAFAAFFHRRSLLKSAGAVCCRCGRKQPGPALRVTTHPNPSYRSGRASRYRSGTTHWTISASMLAPASDSAGAGPRRLRCGAHPAARGGSLPCTARACLCLR